MVELGRIKWNAILEFWVSSLNMRGLLEVQRVHSSWDKDDQFVWRSLSKRIPKEFLSSHILIMVLPNSLQCPGSARFGFFFFFNPNDYH